MLNNKFSILITICLVLILTFVAFLPALNNGITHYDDHRYVTENALIRDLSFDGLKNIFSSFHYGLYKPLVTLSFALEYHFFKINPFVHHLTNIVLHLFNCLLVFLIFRLLAKDDNVALLVTIFFAMHPMHVESVAWITERKDMLYSFFYLGSILAYIYHLITKKRVLIYTSLMFFVFSLFSKPMGVTLPFMLLLIDYLFKRKFTLNSILEKLPFFALSSALLLLSAYGLKPIFDEVSTINTQSTYSFFDSLLVASRGVVFYLQKLFLPINLSCFYAYPEKFNGSLPVIFYISPLILAAISALVFYSKKLTRKIIFGFLFFLLSLLPILQIVRSGPAMVADRYSYLAYLGIFFILAQGFVWLSKNRPQAKVFFSLVLICIISFFFLSTRERTKVWKSDITIWSDVIKNFPNDHVACHNRGTAYLIQGQYKRAIKDLTRSIALNKKKFEPYASRGLAYQKLGQHNKAIKDFTTAININPNNANIYNNRGISYSHLRNFDRAAADFKKALELDIFSPEALQNLQIIMQNNEISENHKHHIE